LHNISVNREKKKTKTKKQRKKQKGTKEEFDNRNSHACAQRLNISGREQLP
jgi:hypothetical protein